MLNCAEDGVERLAPLAPPVMGSISFVAGLPNLRDWPIFLQSLLAGSGPALHQPLREHHNSQLCFIGWKWDSDCPSFLLAGGRAPQGLGKGEKSEALAELLS